MGYNALHEVARDYKRLQKLTMGDRRLKQITRDYIGF